MAILCAFSSNKSPFEVSQGNIVYSFKSGKMQCQSQMDSNGQLTILLTSLTNNTEIQFQKLIKSKKKGKDEYLLKVLMLVTDTSNNLCKSWIDAQEVNIDIDPISVKESNLVGEKIYSSAQAIVLISDS